MPTADNTEVVDILSDLANHPPTPPVTTTPPSSQLHIRIFYGSIPVHTEYLDCKNGCRISSSEEFLPPSASWQKDEKMIQFFEAKNIVLPDNHPQSCAHDIINAMRHGVLIEASDGDVYVTPLCCTVVYCGSSSTDVAQPLEKEVRSKVFDYRNHFRPALEHYALVHSQSPTPYFILGLGQNWGRGRHVTQNLISIVITHAQARQEIDAIGLTHAVTQDLLIDLPYSDMNDQPNTFDMEAEAFLSSHGIDYICIVTSILGDIVIVLPFFFTFIIGLCLGPPVSNSAIPPRQVSIIILCKIVMKGVGFETYMCNSRGLGSI